ncbi:MAG: glycosyltransferase [Lachnospiraceae bacterium]|nr:glycosyltransferase [Lachnospiraceae bacterium]
MDNKVIDFSVIIPHYNIPSALRRLLDTIPVADNLEVIVVDDKSDKELDDLEKLTAEYSNERVKFLRNDTDQKGAGVCRNIGMSNAKGTWLLFADSDDMYAEGAYDVLMNNKDRDEDIIFFMPDSIKSDSGEKADRHIEFCDFLNRYLEEPSRKNELALRYEIVSPWSKMVRRSMVADNSIVFEGSRVANDVVFCRKIGFHARKIAVERDNIYIITEREGSLTTFIGKEAYETRLGEFIKGARFVREHVDGDTWKTLGMSGGYFIHSCRVNKLGIAELIRTIRVLVSNGIRVI